MSDALCTVAYAAERLGLHAKTVLRAIREGRLPATRVGKAYRIRRSDLEAFSGLPTEPAPAPDPPWATAIVDVPGVAPDLARKWARTIPNALNAKPQGHPPLRAEVIYDPARRHLKIVLVGAPRDLANLMGLIAVWLEQLEA